MLSTEPISPVYLDPSESNSDIINLHKISPNKWQKSKSEIIVMPPCAKGCHICACAKSETFVITL